MAIVSDSEVFAYLGISTPTSAQAVLMQLMRPMAEGAVKQYVGYSIEQATHTNFLPSRDVYQGELSGLDSINERVYFEYKDGTEKLYLPERPVRSITTLYEDQSAYGGQGANDFAAATLLTGGTDYFLDYKSSGVSWSGLVQKIAGAWSSRARTIKVTYLAGLTAGEIAGTTAVVGPRSGSVVDLKWATLLAAVVAYKQSQTVEGSNIGPIQSERLADYAVSFGRANEQVFGMKFNLPGEVRDRLEPFRRLEL